MSSVNEFNTDLNSYDYELPSELIAQVPSDEREGARMLVYDEATNQISHSHFSDLASFLHSSTTLVRNNTKVFASRVQARKHITGGKAEFFFLSDTLSSHCVEALIQSNSKKKVGDEFILEGDIKSKIIKRLERKFLVSLEVSDLQSYLSRFAQVPIPPYIRNGEASSEDSTRYQTTYAQHSGSVAAPTAGLHFTDHTFDQLTKKGINVADLTLHVGLGTFETIKSEDIRNHHMHSERFYMSQDEYNKMKNRKILAIGTTSLRVLESFSKDKNLKRNEWNETDIFLYPGIEVTSINAMLTNFHLPKSSLIMLISALIGREKVMELYQEAIDQKYRFYSYGDCMLILRKGYHEV